MNTAALPRLRPEVIVRPFDGGGAKPKYVVAVDGQHFVVTPAIAAILDETRHPIANDCGYEALAHRVSNRLGIPITAQEVELCIRERIPRALFDVTADCGVEPTPLLCRRLLFDAAALKALLSILSPLFRIGIVSSACAVVALIDILIALQAWNHGVERGSSADYVLSFVLTALGIFVHELGHLAACRRFGGHHGGIGVGIYWCLPAFYAEVHGAWVLPRYQRAGVDAGGIYLQFLFCGVIGALYLLFASPALLHTIVLTHFLMLHTLNPALKFDGYWLLSDLAGIHNLHARMRETARGLLRGRSIARGDGMLFAAFVAIVVIYFAYLFAVLGQSLGLAAAGFLTHIATMKLSAPDLLLALGKGTLVAFMLAMASGVAVLIARAGNTLFAGVANEG
jgi:putative peptide zinc metalloprotease protein